MRGHNHLHGFMTLLACFRNQESQYLQPLLQRAAKNLAAEIRVPRLLTSPYEQDDRVHEQAYQNSGRTIFDNT